MPTPTRAHALGPTPLVAPSPRPSLSYVPHSGWGNQLIGLQHALFLALALNRSLVMPHVLKHEDLANGNCRQSQDTTQTTVDLLHRYAELLPLRPPIDRLLDTASWGNVRVVSGLGSGGPRNAEEVAEKCLNETRLLTVLLPQLQRTEAELLMLGSALTLKTPPSCSCAVRYRPDLVANTTLLAQRSVLGRSYDGLHLRLTEHFADHYNATAVVEQALHHDGDGGARPLFLASDDLDAALKLVRSLQHANPGWQARPVVTQRDLLEDDGSGGRAWPDVLPGEDDVAFMRPLVVDAILLTQASRFVETNSFTKLHAGSTFGLHVATLRKCAATPGLNDCSDADVRDGVRWTQRWHAAELRKRGAALSQDPLP